MSELLVFQIQFTDTSRLEDGSSCSSKRGGLSSCSVEPDSMTARFMAGPATGDRLVERIYAIGGLRWCPRHIVRRQDG